MPKTKRSARRFELAPKTLDALRVHQGTQRPKSDWLFPDEAGRPRDQDSVRRGIYKLVKAAELPPIRIHDLRHTCVTLLLAAGVPVHVVSQRVGHASAKMTLDTYAHYMPSMQKQAVQAIDAIYGGLQAA